MALSARAPEQKLSGKEQEMGIGIVFTYLLMAALAAPLLWLMWWGVNSAGSRAGRLNASAVPARGSEAKTAAEMRSQFAFPRPVDVKLTTRRGTVTMYSLSDGKEIATCLGPNHAGKCPRPSADGIVPCAGCVLALPQPIRGSVEWHIPAGYQACLLGSYDVFRQAGPAN
jgi:hypothetical protein